MNDKGNSLTDLLGGQQFHFNLNIKLKRKKGKERTDIGFDIVDGGSDDEEMATPRETDPDL